MSRFCRLCLMFVFLVSHFGLLIDRRIAAATAVHSVMLASELPELGVYEIVRTDGLRQLVYIWHTLVPYDWLALPDAQGLRLGLYPVVIGFTTGNRYVYSLYVVPEGDYFVIRPGCSVFVMRIIGL